MGPCSPGLPPPLLVRLPSAPGAWAPRPWACWSALVLRPLSFPALARGQHPIERQEEKRRNQAGRQLSPPTAPRPSAAQRGGRKPGPASSGGGPFAPQPCAFSPPTCRVLPEDLSRRYTRQKLLAHQRATGGCEAFKTTCPAACLTVSGLQSPGVACNPEAWRGAAEGVLWPQPKHPRNLGHCLKPCTSLQSHPRSVSSAAQRPRGADAAEWD